MTHAAVPVDRLPFAHSLARRAGGVLVFNTLLGLANWGVQGGSWSVPMFYTHATGLSIWLLIECALPWARRGGGIRYAVMTALAVPPGYLIGTWLGDLYCGCSSLDAWQQAPRGLVGYLLLTAGTTSGIAYFFFSRARDRERLRSLAIAQRDTAEAQLRLLASQLEPHMLFNTLANLRVLIALDADRAQAMLDQLIAFLRSTLAASRAGGSHSLADEFARLADYLGLMQVRMGDRLKTRLDLPPELAACRVAPLLLQPLVENAIRHGLEPHVAGGRLDVSARREGDELVLRVRDTGAGLSDQPSGDGTHVGLQLVRDRLRARSGEAARFELKPADDGEGGTLAIVRMPIEEAKP